MTHPTPWQIVATLVLVTLAAPSAVGQAPASTPCKRIHAELVESRFTTGCKPGHAFCFLGEVKGNHGLQGTTYFRGDSSGVAPPASPGFLPYGGAFEYITAQGTLVLRETGIVNQTQGNVESGAISAFQEIVDATGELAGSVGYFFVSGFNRNGQIVTTVSGELCTP